MILPAIEVETCHFSPRSSITSLSSPRRGYSSLSLEHRLGQFGAPKQAGAGAWAGGSDPPGSGGDGG